LIKLFDIFIVVFVEDMSFVIANCIAGSLADAASPPILPDRDDPITSFSAAISLVLLQLPL
jgi:hypothetical protein